MGEVNIKWHKLLFLRVIFNTYEKAKSCLQHRRLLSDYFQCNIGFRQGENLSPILFALFVNDLNVRKIIQHIFVNVC